MRQKILQSTVRLLKLIQNDYSRNFRLIVSLVIELPRLLANCICLGLARHAQEEVLSPFQARAQVRTVLGKPPINVGALMCPTVVDRQYLMLGCQGGKGKFLGMIQAYDRKTGRILEHNLNRYVGVWGR